MFGNYFGNWFSGWFGDSHEVTVGTVSKMRFKPLLYSKAVIRTWQ